MDSVWNEGRCQMAQSSVTKLAIGTGYKDHGSTCIDLSKHLFLLLTLELLFDHPYYVSVFPKITKVHIMPEFHNDTGFNVRVRVTLTEGEGNPQFFIIGIGGVENWARDVTEVAYIQRLNPADPQLLADVRVVDPAGVYHIPAV